MYSVSQIDGKPTADIHSEPTYNLKAVVRETGLKADTLRAWERRYGLPIPQRTASGHRLYSKRDIGILKWLLARQREGLSISRAVALWQRLVEEGVDPIDVNELEAIPSYIDEPRANIHQPALTHAAIQPKSLDGHVAGLRQEWIASCLSYDEAKAEQVLTTAFSLFDTETVCIELLMKGISEIGIGWSYGRVTAQQEHFASTLAARRIHALHNGTPRPTKNGTVLMGCPAGEEHVFPTILLSLLLRRRGWNVVFLGANIPLENLTSTIKTIQPTLVILTAQQLHTAGTLLEMGQVLIKEQVPLGYGGAVFMRLPALQECIPGHYLGDRIDLAPLIVEQIMTTPRVKPALQSIPAEHTEGLVAFKKSRWNIENQVWQSMERFDTVREVIDGANQCMGQNIVAALSLSKSGIVDSDLDDIHMLLVSHYNMPATLVNEYLKAYHQSTEYHAGSDGRVILNWLQKLLVDTNDNTYAPTQSLA